MSTVTVLFILRTQTHIRTHPHTRTAFEHSGSFLLRIHMQPCRQCVCHTLSLFRALSLSVYLYLYFSLPLWLWPCLVLALVLALYLVLMRQHHNVFGTIMTHMRRVANVYTSVNASGHTGVNTVATHMLIYTHCAIICVCIFI